MIIKINTIKSIAWFFAIFFLVLSFPFQVYSNSPIPSIIPYIIIAFTLLMNFSLAKNGAIDKIKFSLSNMNIGIFLFIIIYLLLFFINTIWQTLFSFITPYEAISAFVIYVFPVTFYWYFRKLASEKEIRFVLIAMAICGLIVALFFAYDSYSKFALNRVTDYALKAFDYSVIRSKLPRSQANIARINLGSGSFGLLQTHSVSGAWVTFGTFAVLSLIPSKNNLIRIIFIMAFGILLFISLNFTSIIAFSIILFLFEFRGAWLFMDQPKLIIRNLLAVIIIAISLVNITLYIGGDSMAPSILKIFAWQRDFLFGTGGIENQSKVGMILDTLTRYFQNIFENPHSLILGDGFSSFGFQKGGDIGFIDSMAKFGLLFYLLFIFGLLSLIFGQIKYLLKAKKSKNIIQFSICIMLFVVIADGHYSVWTAKSVLPIIFFTIALLERYGEKQENL